MKRSNLFLALFSLVLVSCGNNPNQKQNDQRIRDVYEAYVTNQRQTGGDILSYEEWLATIKGEKGDKGADGKDGRDGIDGTNGKDGQNGKDGNSILTGNGIPSTTLGNDGDSYIDTTTFDYYIKSNGVWTKRGNLKGANGTDGKDGRDGTDGTNGKDGLNGSDGKDGQTPYIGANGNWWVGEKDTGVRAEGRDGKDGLNGADGKDGVDGKDGANGKDGVDGANGKDGQTPYIGANGNWWIGEKDTGVKADYSSKETILYSYGQDLRAVAFADAPVNLPTTTAVYSETDGWKEARVHWITPIRESYKPGVYLFEGDVDGLEANVKCTLNVLTYNTTMQTVCGYVNSNRNNVPITVTLYNGLTSYAAQTNFDGYYSFPSVPFGTYSLKAEAAGYYTAKETGITLSKVSEEKDLYHNVSGTNLSLRLIQEHSYYYSWSINEYCLSDETRSYVNPTDPVDLNGEKYYTANNSAANSLKTNYQVYLVGDGWTSDYSSRLLDMFKKAGVIPSEPSTWSLTASHVDKDLTFSQANNAWTVELSLDALQHSIPTIGTLNGTKGTFFSNRLYHAVIRFLTNNGKNTDLVNSILMDKFGVSIYIPNYEELTNGITDETAEAFQQFTPEELLSILTMYEEMPQGMHKIKGFNYLLRRKNGQIHPLYPQAAAVTWPTKGYIEYMESAFTSSQFHTYRLILHEKSHMLYAHVFSDSLKKQWQKIGGWTYDEAADSWSTNKQTEFVTAYAHSINPDEDMAETIAYYICDPEKLMSRSPAKYQFIKDFIFEGTAYKRVVREDLTFDVYNLYPDYDYPGQIMEYSVYSDSKPFEDKTFHLTLKLNHSDGLYDGASRAQLRIESPNKKQIKDIWFAPTNEDGSVLEGDITLSKYVQKGYWSGVSLTITDVHGNERHEEAKDYGFELFVDSPLEDLEAPKLVPGSIAISSVNKQEEDRNGILRNYKEWDVKLKADEEHPEVYNHSSQIRIAPVENYTIGSVDKMLYLEEDGFFHARFKSTEYWAKGTWEIRSISLYDEAGNTSNINSSDPELANDNIQFIVDSENPDTEGPTIDVNTISIVASPTNPDAPNGETNVTITFTIRDNLSGFSYATLFLIDPQGVRHQFDTYNDNQYLQDYYLGDPKADLIHKAKITLPAGSAPGKWGLADMSVKDLVGNVRYYDFTETITFTVSDNA